MKSELNLEGGSGLAEVLKNNQLRVPLNQREYKWGEDNVLDMLQDLANAMRLRRSSYFMGTIVMTKCSNEEWEIADGQQRLATTTIILCVIRDLMIKLKAEKLAQGLEQEFISGIDPETGDDIARLTLNADDNHFFYNKIVRQPKDRLRDLHPTLTSHQLLLGAYQTTLKYFENLKRQVGTGFLDTLKEWRRYLLNSAKVLVLKVPDPTWAFIMFETLNDRGIKTSQVDLVKNYLFQESGRRSDEAHRAWSSMRGIIESISDADDLVMEYMRWVACVLYGMTREKDVFDRISENSRGESNSIGMLVNLEKMANDYSALFNADHPKWNKYPPQIRDAIRTLLDLDVKQMRPLLLSTARNFSKKELLVTFKGLVSWAVRLTIAGGSKAGRLDTFYANLSHDVEKGKIKNYKALLTASSDVIPTDAEFKSYFETLRTRVSKSARYYLRCLEQTVDGVKDPQWVPNEDTNAVNLEHVMPKTVCEEWSASEQDVETHAHRLGNLVLLRASDNVLADRKSFNEKKSVLMKSSFQLTKMVGKSYKKWGVAEIEARQKKLAAYAPKTWPI